MNYKKGTQTRGCMKSVMRYVSQVNKTLWNGQQLVSGIDCQPETAFDEFLSTKLLHHKDGGVMFYHMVQSFPKGADVDPRTVFRVELRLLRQVADFDAGLRTRFTFDLGVDTGHDAQQGRFTGAVQTEHTDFRAREKAEGDIFQNMTFRRNNFADTMHGINELSHVGLRLFLF